MPIVLPMQPRHIPEILSIGEAARILGISVDTLRRWSNDGRIPTITLPSGQRRFHREDLDVILGKGKASA